MEILTKIIELIISNIDWGYMLSVNVCTFIVIHSISKFKIPTLNKWTKRIVSAVVGIIIAVLVILIAKADFKIILYSFILSFVSWDYIFKPIVKLLKIDYKK